jgi:hypothetical protein
LGALGDVDVVSEVDMFIFMLASMRIIRFA